MGRTRLPFLASCLGVSMNTEQDKEAKALLRKAGPLGALYALKRALAISTNPAWRKANEKHLTAACNAYLDSWDKSDLEQACFIPKVK
jgi:hypothetical protein